MRCRASAPHKLDGGRNGMGGMIVAKHPQRRWRWWRLPRHGGGGGFQGMQGGGRFGGGGGARTWAVVPALAFPGMVLACWRWRWPWRHGWWWRWFPGRRRGSRHGSGGRGGAGSGGRGGPGGQAMVDPDPGGAPAGTLRGRGSCWRPVSTVDRRRRRGQDGSQYQFIQARRLLRRL
ncbi:MAG: hypothetical protein U0798_19555 [Gemmataceae bacterium]